MPSSHDGWSLLVGMALVPYGRRLWLRLSGLALPGFMILTVLITGNHLPLDVAAGVLVVILAFVCKVRGQVRLYIHGMA